ncbi:MAG TPA: hypothetical protein VKI44_43225 [Acetobacteraceae bacterium]|nr:hypothetical protein [Acetobacteraceae bacterium]
MGGNVHIRAMTTLICAITTLLIAVGALILAVAGRAALDPEVVGYGMRRDSQISPAPSTRPAPNFRLEH